MLFAASLYSKWYGIINSTVGQTIAMATSRIKITKALQMQSVHVAKICLNLHWLGFQVKEEE